VGKLTNFVLILKQQDCILSMFKPDLYIFKKKGIYKWLENLVVVK